jgi:hypothetical protein
MLYFFLQFGIHQPKSQQAWKHSELLLEKKQLVPAFTAATCLSLKAIVILQALAVFVKQGSQTAREVRGKGWIWASALKQCIKAISLSAIYWKA